MDWLWPLNQEYIFREVSRKGETDNESLQRFFIQALAESTATLFVMAAWHDTVRFQGLGRWPIHTVPELLTDPNAFIDERFGGGKFKINFHHGDTFVCTHNFRTYSEERWREMEWLVFD